jgi:predicted nucleic acid-binding protein
MNVAYVDASALTKLILDEPGSAAMHRWYIEAERIASSVVGVIETRRAVARHVDTFERLEVLLRSVVKLELDRTVGGLASTLQPAALRTLDAIHLASAMGLADQLDAFVTYDDRLADAARMVGLPVVRPA